MTGDAAWSFAREFYAHPGAAPALLRLQDEHGVDVPLVLVLLHTASGGASPDEAAVQELMRVSGAWARNVIMPLRQARRAIKAASPVQGALYEQVKAAELAAEEAIIRSLAPQTAAPAAASGATSPEAAAGAALETYRRLLGLAGRSFDPIAGLFAAARALRTAS